MKNLLLLAFFTLLTLTACQSSKAPNFVIMTPHQRLMTKLDTLRYNGIMYGHTDDPVCGIGWRGDENRSDTRDVTEDYPAVMGFDLSGIELDRTCNMDSVPFSRIKDEMVAQHLRGGIVLVTWHPGNPVTGGDARDVSDTSAVRQILPGGEKHDMFVQWMFKLSSYLNTITGKHGLTVPYILQPWEDANVRTYWWGSGNCSDEQYKALWCMLQDYLKSRLYANPVWCYSTALRVRWEKQRYEERCPDLKRIDVIGLNACANMDDAVYASLLQGYLLGLHKFARKSRKILAITRCGLPQTPAPDWWSRVLLPRLDGFQLSFVMTGSNAGDTFQGVSASSPTADDFLQVVRNRQLLLLHDVAPTDDIGRDSSEMLWL